MRTYFIAGNWKMNKTVPETISTIENLKPELAGVGHKLMIAPPFTALAAAVEAAKGSNILIGAQNVSNEDSGAHTGEISPLMLKDIGVDVVIIGHSERRLIYQERNEFINAKVKKALSHDFQVILCVGETLEQREAGQAVAVVDEHVEKGLAGVPETDLANITIAYEPVWAIGTGKTASPEDADEIHAAIRKKLADLYSSQAAESMCIQYGGSVKPENAASLMAKENIDGALVGGASLKASTFVPIAKFDS